MPGGRGHRCHLPASSEPVETHQGAISPPRRGVQGRVRGRCSQHERGHTGPLSMPSLPPISASSGIPMPQRWGSYPHTSYPHNAAACPLLWGFNPTPGVALPGPKSHEVVPKIVGSGMMRGSQPCCWDLVLLSGRVLGRRQVRRHRNCHGELPWGNATGK